MQKREKILIAVVAVAALYLAATFLLPRHKRATAAATNPVSAGLRAKLAAISSPDNRRMQNLASRIGRPWDDIFADHSLDKKAFARDDQQKAAYDKLAARANKLIYSGYLAMGKSRIAIINGQDYRAGDKIDGFVLRKISPVAVQLTQNNFSFTVISRPLPTIGAHSTDTINDRKK
jgi:hypothetical protein